MSLPPSTLVRMQKRTFGPVEYNVGTHRLRVAAFARWDDECGNGRNSFSITGEIQRLAATRWVWESGGCIHDVVAKHFPELRPLIKYHLMMADGPMHYVSNTVYHASQGCFAYARSTAVWPDATDEELMLPGPILSMKLRARLPQLMEEFKAAITAPPLSFTY